MRWKRRSFFDEFFEDMMDLMREFEESYLFGNRYIPRKGLKTEELREYREPMTDVWETDDEVIAVLELPGVNKEDIDLKVTSRSLEVKAKKKEDKKEEGFEERTFKGYYITLPLPAEVDPDNVKATYKNGVLEVKIKKSQKEEKKKVKIE